MVFRDYKTGLLNRKVCCILLLIAFLTGINSYAQNLTTDNSGFFYQISPLFDFKQSAVSLTFDDGYIDQFKIGIPLLKKRNLPATFYVITGNIDSSAKNIILKKSSVDYEIGSHTMTHPDLSLLGSAEVYQELFNSKTYLQKYFGINAGLTMSYPYGKYNNQVIGITKKNYLAARTTATGFNSFYSLNRYELKSFGFDDRTGSLSANVRVDYAIQNHLWLIEMIHGINNGSYLSIDSIILSDHLDYICKNSDKIWCSSVSGIIKYLDESKSAKVICDFCTDTVYKVKIDDSLNDSIYNQLLSLKIKVPGNWDSISISTVNTFKTKLENSSKFILFNALPDNKEIVIRPHYRSEPAKETGIRLVYLSENPFIDKIKMAVEALDQQDIDMILCSLSGKVLAAWHKKNATGVINLQFDTSGASSGIYFLRISGTKSGTCIIKKLIKI